MTRHCQQRSSINSLLPGTFRAGAIRWHRVRSTSGPVERLPLCKAGAVDLCRAFLGIAIALSLLSHSPYSQAQSVAATLRGQVVAGASPADGAQITATNTQTGFTRSMQADANGNYKVGGLPPGSYRIDAKSTQGATSQVVVLQVGQIATLDLDVGRGGAATTAESVTVTATKLYETRTSEIASYVSQRQIEALPQNSRNFLAFADTIPGVQFVTSGDGATSELRSGAQSANGVNVFIDGVGQKNYVLRGGISGQDSSRGNPFPQLAIGEYKVISSNYKAEFDQVSSAAVIAVTRSGTNEFKSEGFWDRTAENWRAADPIEARSGKKAASEQEHYGVAVGGPILRDRMHFFATYERKEFETPKTVSFGQGATPSGQFLEFIGVSSSPFEEDLFFGKLDWTPGDAHLFELTAKVRDESEIAGLGGQDAPDYASTRENQDTRADLRYQFSAAGFLNDAHITYEEASFNPRPVTIAPGYQLTTSDPNRVILNLGGGRDFQDKGQKGWGIQDDVTFDAFDWLGAHTIKTGVKFKRIEINAFEQQPYNPQFAYDINGSLTVPFRVQFGAPLPGFPDRNVTSENKQFGIYIQDDWEVNDRLLLNLGVRWDYEETPSYLDYVTPADVIAGLNTVDTSAGAAPGQTYAQTLARGGIDINDYISTGNNRDAFDGAIQPRIGFSFDLTEDQRHVVFGGAGRSYDRNVFDYLAPEVSKGTFPTYTRDFDAPGHPCTPGVDPLCLAFDPAFFTPGALAAVVAANPSQGREVNLINNKLHTPYSDQYSLGIRNRVEFLDQEWNTVAAVSYIESKDGVVFLLGNRRGDGSFYENPGDTWSGQPFGNGIPGLGSLIIGKNGLATRAKSFLGQIEKPYTEASHWSATIAYTYTSAKENRGNIGKSDEHFIFDYPDIGGYGWHESTGVARHRLVASGILDAPWGLTLSGKLTVSTPFAHEAINCRDAATQRNCFFQPFKPDTTLGYQQVDLAIQKIFGVWSDLRLRVRADVLNVFDSENPDTYDVYRGDAPLAVGGPSRPNANLGRETAYRQPTRTFKLSFGFNW